MTIGIIGGQRSLLAAMLESQENNLSQPPAMKSKEEILDDKAKKEAFLKEWDRRWDRMNPKPKSQNQKENEARAARNRAAKRRRKSK